MKLREVRRDDDFNDLFSDSNIEFLEWIVMMRLNLSYEEVHGKVFVKDTKLDRINREDTRKTVDFHISYENYDFIIEMNNNYDGNYIRNMLYLATLCLKKYKKADKRINKYYNYTKTFCLISLNWFNTEELRKLVKAYDIIKIPANAKGTYNLFEIEHINLDKYRSVCYNDVTKEQKTL